MILPDGKHPGRAQKGVRMGIIPDPGRLGFKELFKDHFKTFYEIDENDRKVRSNADIFYFIILPVFSGVIVFAFDLKIKGFAEILAGLSVFTALLFGLLIHIFSLRMSIRDIKSVPKYGELSRLIDETRANVAYSCALGLALVVISVLTVALSDDLSNGANRYASGGLTALFFHLFLTILMVLKRIRAAYFLLAKQPRPRWE